MAKRENVITKSAIIDCYLDHKTIDRHIVSELDNIIHEYENYNKKTLYIKTGGITTNLIGTAGLMLAPFTGGATISLTIIGCIASVLGLIINTINDTKDTNKSNDISKRVNELLISRNNCIEKEADIMNNLLIYAHTITGNWTKSEKIELALKTHTEREILVDEQSLPEDWMSPIEDFPIVNIINEKSYINALESVSSNVAQSSAALAVNIISRESFLAFAVTTVGKTIFRVGLVGGIALATVDVFRLISSWNTENITIKEIKELRVKIQNEITICERNLYLLKLYESEAKGKRVEDLEHKIRKLSQDIEERERLHEERERQLDERERVNQQRYDRMLKELERLNRNN